MLVTKEILPSWLREENFLTTPGEEVLLATRKNWCIVLFPIIISSIIIVMFMLVATFLTVKNLLPPVLFISAILLGILVENVLVSKILIDWNFNFFVVTTKKILEIQCSPLASCNTNSIFLDKVRTTEIDVRVKGLINELLDVGDITIIFDEMSNKRVFNISEINHPRELGEMLGKRFEPRVGDYPMQNSLRTNFEMQPKLAIPLGTYF